MSELPRGAFDKVKRAELARIATELLRREFVPPRDEFEVAIADIFADVLGSDRVGAFDNFFQLGGDSLRGMRAMARVQSRFGVTIGVEACSGSPPPRRWRSRSARRGSGATHPPLVPTQRTAA